MVNFKKAIYHDDYKYSERVNALNLETFWEREQDFRPMRVNNLCHYIRVFGQTRWSLQLLLDVGHIL